MRHRTPNLAGTQEKDFDGRVTERRWISLPALILLFAIVPILYFIASGPVMYVLIRKTPNGPGAFSNACEMSMRPALSMAMHYPVYRHYLAWFVFKADQDNRNSPTATTNGFWNASILAPNVRDTSPTGP